jgi:hypothetical protein
MYVIKFFSNQKVIFKEFGKIYESDQIIVLFNFSPFRIR